MRAIYLSSILIIIGINFCMIGSLVASTGRVSQYPGTWNWHGKRGYYYAKHNLLQPKDVSPQYFYLIFYPNSKSRYVDYYDPKKRLFFGRFDTQANGDAVFSLLAPKDRKGNLKDIPMSAFNKPGPMPKLSAVNLVASKFDVQLRRLDTRTLPRKSPRADKKPKK